MRLSNGFVIDKEKTFGELKFTAVRDVFLQNEDGTPSTQLKKRIYDLKCSLHGGIIPVSVPPEVPLREFPYNAVVELVIISLIGMPPSLLKSTVMTVPVRITPMPSILSCTPPLRNELKKPGPTCKPSSYTKSTRPKLSA